LRWQFQIIRVFNVKKTGEPRNGVMKEGRKKNKTVRKGESAEGKRFPEGQKNGKAAEEN